MSRRLILTVLLAVATAAPLHAETVSSQLQTLTAQARSENSAFAGFSAARGQTFFTSLHGNDWSCSSCHTKNPMQSGKHAVTGRVIQPMAPAANPERFTDSAKTEKWFRRNCKDVVSRECSAQEKGDVLTWLQSLK